MVGILLSKTAKFACIVKCTGYVVKSKCIKGKAYP